MSSVQRWTTKGWCPGALRPMESGDGLILRVRPRGAHLSAEALRAVADVSQRFGNGHLDLTRRANIQIRGVTPHTLPSAQDTLGRAGLLDRDEAAESVRNVLLSPLAGRDASARLNGAAIASALEAGLLGDAGLRALPAKFSFLVDEGGRLGLADIAADIRIEASGRYAQISVGGDAARAVPLATVEPADAAGTALAVAAAFLDLARANGARSMRALLDALSPAALAKAAGLPGRAAAARRKAPVVTPRAAVFGRQPGFYGIGAAFGSLDASALDALAALSPGGVHLTPWRAMLLPEPAAADEAKLAALGLVTQANDPRLSVAACPGQPACASGEAGTRALANRLAARLGLPTGDGVLLHVSGCAKGCAMSGPAPFTLVAHEGRFDLVLDGGTRDSPVLSGLNADQAERALGVALSADRALAS